VIKKTELILAGQSKAQMFDHKGQPRQKGIAGAGIWGNVLHAVKGRVLERS
jgi:hypothetical protein